jgi:membrane-associated phospholipid phosphatase
MFETEINLWLQAHGSELATRVWWLVSELGRADVYMVLMIVVTFGVDLRRGWLLGQVLLWTAGLTELAKQSLALPRPHDVDSRVLYPPTGEAQQQVFTGRGGMSFFAGLPRDVIDFYRARGPIAWGLPSGHTSVATACWGSLAVLLRSRRWWLVTALAALVMGLSRLYLGRHFLADVLAGAGLGALFVVLLYLLLNPRDGSPSLLEATTEDLSRQVSGRPFIAFAFLAPSLLTPFAWLTGDFWAAQLWGWNLAFWLLVRRRRSYAGGGLGARALRVALGLAIAAATLGACDLLLGLVGWTSSILAQLLAHGLTVFTLTVITARLSDRLGLYGQSGRPADHTGRPEPAS